MHSHARLWRRHACACCAVEMPCTRMLCRCDAVPSSACMLRGLSRHPGREMVGLGLQAITLSAALGFLALPLATLQGRMHRNAYCCLASPRLSRTAAACSPDVAKVLLKTLEDGVALTHKDQVARKVCLNEKMLSDAIDNVRGGVMICYPMGLPEWDLVRCCLEDCEDLSETQYAAEEMDPDTAQLWFAGKQMAPEKQLKDYVGRHEKSRVVVKLQKKGSGAPGREPVVDAETQKAMMAFYHKKQEEQKKLAENEDDAYGSAAWASSSSLKAHFSGVQSVRLPR
eukprot:364327-Chlamydomonas_euryale.AAC.7